MSVDNNSDNTMMDAEQLSSRVPQSAFAFRGYNSTNLGRSSELLAHPAYAAIVREHLQTASRVCSDVLGKRVDLIDRVRRNRETTLRTYTEALALIVAMEIAQIELLREVHGIDIMQAELVYGYSLGEISALVASGMFRLEDALWVPLALSVDTAVLAADVTLGVLFSRGRALSIDEVQRLCFRINHEGAGVIGISTILSPNSLLLMGQQNTIDRFSSCMHEALSADVHLRKNKQRWPPIHTPIVWEKFIPNRCGMLLHGLGDGVAAPRPPVLSMVTGKTSYSDLTIRDILCDWTDHPQRLWDAVYATLASDIETVIHVGPTPNIIPATFKRIADNVEVQTRSKLGVRALAIARPWLKAILPQRTALLRAPLVKHLILEDWLLEQTGYLGYHPRVLRR